jgi:hypothetical protein
MDGKSLLAEIRENHRKLDSCDGHNFNIPENPKLNQRLECSKCGGTLRFEAIGYYIRGYVHAGGNADDVWPGWNKDKAL